MLGSLCSITETTLLPLLFISDSICAGLRLVSNTIACLEALATFRFNRRRGGLCGGGMAAVSMG